MIKKLFLAASLLYTTVSFAQVSTLIDKVNFDQGTILVGMASDYNQDKTYDKYNFYIDNVQKINGIRLELEHGYELSNKVTDQNHFMIYAIKDRKIVDQWLVNPRLHNVFNNGIAYSYDADKLKRIAEKFPFEYEVERRTYQNEKEYKKNLKTLNLDSSIFLLYEPNFEFEGTFEVSIKKDEKFTNATEAEVYLRDLSKKLTKKNVVISYALNEENLRNPSQMTMIVAGPKVLFDKMNLEGHTKSEWKPEIFEAIIVRKK